MLFRSLLFSVEESLDAIVSQIDDRASDSIALGINKSGLVVKNSEAAAEKPSPTPPAIA